MGPVTELFSEAAIARRVEELAGEIAARVSGEVTLVGVLKGSFVFMADLMRALDRRGLATRVGFMTLSSYGKGKVSSGRVRLVGDPPGEISGRRVLLVEDILDTGRSVAFAKGVLEECGAARVWICALLDKPSRHAVDIAPDFVGFTVGDHFVVGYGIDYAEDHRHLRFIGRVD